MRLLPRLPVLALLLAAAVAAAPAAAQDPAAAEGKEAKVRRLLVALKLKENFLAEVRTKLEQAEGRGSLPQGFRKAFDRVADIDALMDILIRRHAEHLDGETLDAALAFYDSPAGRRFSVAQAEIARKVGEETHEWARRTTEAALAAVRAGAGEGGDEEGAEDPNARPSSAEDMRARVVISSNETVAIATLRNLTACQAHIRASGAIDADRDGNGEFGTILELTGSVGVRAAYDADTRKVTFATQGSPVAPAILSPSLAGVDAEGIVVKNGYCYRIFLPDGAIPAGFVHETGPSDAVGLKGGTGSVGCNMSEHIWCAYAWPERRNSTGNRVFFVNQSGDVFQSENRLAKWEGTERPPRPDAAFLGAGISAPVAVGTAGRDGEIWKVTF